MAPLTAGKPQRVVVLLFAGFLAVSVIVLAFTAEPFHARSASEIATSFQSSAADPSIPLLADDFEKDTSVNGSLWTINGQEATAAMSSWGYDHLVSVQPTLAFSSSDGMTLSGVTANYTFADVQSLQAFFPPFDIQAQGMVTVSNGNPLVLAIDTATAAQGGAVVCNCGSTNPYYGMGAWVSVGNGTPILGIYSLDSKPLLDTWYTLNLDVNGSGVATFTATQGTTLLGTVSYYIGLGEYYLFLGQFVDAPPPGNGPNSASWSYLYVNQTVAPPTPPPGPQVLAVIADPASVTVGDTTTIDVVVSGGMVPLTTTYAGLPTGCSSKSTLELSCSPTAAGSYLVKVNVTDDLGRLSTGVVNLTVLSATTPFLTSGSELALGIGAIAVVLAVVAVVFAARRRSPPPGAPPSAPQAPVPPPTG